MVVLTNGAKPYDCPAPTLSTPCFLVHTAYHGFVQRFLPGDFTAWAAPHSRN